MCFHQIRSYTNVSNTLIIPTPKHEIFPLISLRTIQQLMQTKLCPSINTIRNYPLTINIISPSYQCFYHRSCDLCAFFYPFERVRVQEYSTQTLIKSKNTLLLNNFPHFCVFLLLLVCYMIYDNGFLMFFFCVCSHKNMRVKSVNIHTNRKQKKKMKWICVFIVSAFDNKYVFSSARGSIGPSH